jgi:aminomethyltransferase
MDNPLTASMMTEQTAVLSTELHDKHLALGAKMVTFAGYHMPLQYQGLRVEHHAVRQSLGVFDVSHMGEFWVKGPDALAFLQSVISNDVAKLTSGKIQYACLPNDKGGIVDDLLVYCESDSLYLLVVNASNMAKDMAWLEGHAGGFDATISDASLETSLLAVQGPKTTEALQSLTEVNLADMTYYTYTWGRFAGVDGVLISATGYTGSGGFELYIPKGKAAQVWDAILEAGQPYGIEPAGLAARDTLRLEMGFCLYGNDIDESTSPLEAGLGWITKFTKTFINWEALLEEKTRGVSRRLVGFHLIDRGIPRQGYPITNAQGDHIGIVTSGTMSPSLNQAIGMGYVPKALSKADTEIFIEVRGKLLQAKVTKLPFYQG